MGENEKKEKMSCLNFNIFLLKSIKLLRAGPTWGMVIN